MQHILEKIATHAQQQPAAEAVVTPQQTISYAQLQSLIEQTRAELETLAIQRLAIYQHNTLDWLVIDLAAAAAGIPVVPVPLFFSDEQIAHLLHDSDVDALYSRDGVASATAFNRTLVSDVLGGHYQMLAELRKSQALLPFTKVTYTSGSTGTPKGVCLSGETLDSITASLASALHSSDLQRHLCLIPFATLLENVAGVYVALYMGRSVVIDNVSHFGLRSNHNFDVNAFSDIVEHTQAESVILLPQMLKAITEQADISKLGSLKFIAVGGGKVSGELLEQAKNKGLPVYEGYGLSECGSVVSLNVPEANRIGSVGKPLPHAHVVISDNGEVIVTGTAMQGYLNHNSDQEKIAEKTIATGDAGFIDDEGYLFITGRIKNTIVSSFGRNISPEWVESRFLADEAIRQIAVYGEAKPCLSAVIHCAAGVDHSQLTQVIARINRQLPDYAQIARWCISSQAFSTENGMLTENGKLCRQVIQQQFIAFIDAVEGAA